jgi:hypothetical protein
VLLAGDPAVPLNTCYVCRCTDVEDAFALCTLLNSPLSAAWLNAIAEPARGGFHRYLAWTVGMLPLPPNWRAARAALAPIAADALGGRIPDDKELLSATIEAFDVRREEVLPLVEWMSR